jgi:hypothetical protein
VARYSPSGFIRHNQLFLNRLYQKYAFYALDVEKRRLYVDRALAARDPEEMFGRNPYRIMSAYMYPATTALSIRLARVQTTLDTARLACAFERYRLAHHKYPATLRELEPQFVSKLPNDVVTGEALRYTVVDDNAFLLYSVALNGKDDDGAPAPSNQTASKGDWVWPSEPRLAPKAR